MFTNKLFLLSDLQHYETAKFWSKNGPFRDFRGVSHFGWTTLTGPYIWHVVELWVMNGVFVKLRLTQKHNFFRLAKHLMLQKLWAQHGGP